MYRRQFISPLLKRPSSASDTNNGEESLKKKARSNVALPSEPARTPLLNLQVPNYSPVERKSQGDAYFNVLWRNPTTKKNKTWDGDGVLALEDGLLTLRDSDGKKYHPYPKSKANLRIAIKPWSTGSLSMGDTLKIGNKDVEVVLKLLF